MTTKTATKPCYSVAEANRTLPLVRSIAQDIVAEYTRLKAMREGAKTGREARRTDATGLKPVTRTDDVEHEMEDGAARIDGFIKELSELGCELRDPEHGFVDFPSERAGRAVWLSWRLGEDAVSHWHGSSESVSHRRPVDASVKRERRQADSSKADGGSKAVEGPTE